MNLSEHQAKHLLSNAGLNVPSGVCCDVAELAESLTSGIAGPWVIKAQIPAGGRANGHFRDDAQARGGVRFADSMQQVVSAVRQMLGGVLITEQTGRSGALVRSVYIEQKCPIRQECYLALTIDRTTGELIFLGSRAGGTQIEKRLCESPEELTRVAVKVDEAVKATSAPFDTLFDALELPESVKPEFQRIVSVMHALFVDKDMLLLEINPLALTDNEQLMVLDALVVYDDNALFRQGHEEQLVAYDDLPEAEYNALVHGLNYIRLEGDIATLSSGAGLAMATMDAIREIEGAPANFLDVPPSTAVEHIRNALSLLFTNPSTRCVLINVFGGGIMRCDAVADALLTYHQQEPIAVPVVVRLAGTNAELARQRLATSMPQVQIASDLGEAAALAVALGNAAEDLTDSTAPNGEGRLWRKVLDKITAPAH